MTFTMRLVPRGTAITRDAPAGPGTALKTTQMQALEDRVEEDNATVLAWDERVGSSRRRIEIRIGRYSSIEALTHGFEGVECLAQVEALERLDAEATDSECASEFTGSGTSTRRGKKKGTGA